MRKTNLFGASFLALAASALPFTAIAQTSSPTPSTTPAAPAPATTPPPADVTPTAPAPDSSTAPPPASADKPAKKAVHHKTTAHKGKLVATKAGDKAVDDLNSASLDSAKSGKPFTAPPTPDAAKKEAHAPVHKKATHHVAKKKTTTTDTAAPATDTAPATPPADAPK